LTSPNDQFPSVQFMSVALHTPLLQGDHSPDTLKFPGISLTIT